MLEAKLRLVAWELTRRCNLYCAHCRASAARGPYPGELTTSECYQVIDQIAQLGKPILILSGGEPLLRNDFFDIASYATGKGLRTVLGTNGTIIDSQMAAKLKQVPISRVGVSLDFPHPELQDRFRGTVGAFDTALKGIACARQAGLAIQINSTITKQNAPYLDELLALALEVGAVAFHPFLLVPTGRGKGLAAEELSPEEHEQVLHWIYDKQSELGERIFFKPTDAPQYWRVVQQRGGAMEGHGSMNSLTRGCLAGIGFCFISHVGKIQGCGYLDVEAGDLKQQSLSQVWQTSPLFLQLRDLSNIKGKCGVCEFKKVCGGCRARAYEMNGDYLAEETCCIYQPRAAAGAGKGQC
jgi:heme b synthase